MIGQQTTLSDEFLAQLVRDLDTDTIRAIILHGSYARKEAVPPYSDVDLVCIISESSAPEEQKQFLFQNGYLLSISRRPLSIYRRRFARPEQAIFAVPGVREARILLDKDQSFKALQEEAWAWTWEPLQAAANAFASQLMTAQTELVLKVLRSLALQDYVALADMMLDLFSAVTEAIAVQRGVLMQSGNTYFHQVQQAVGEQSAWTCSHLRAAGITPQPPLSIKQRGYETLRLYKETVRLLQPAIFPEHQEVIAPVIQMVDSLADKKIH